MEFDFCGFRLSEYLQALVFMGIGILWFRCHSESLSFLQQKESNQRNCRPLLACSHQKAMRIPENCKEGFQ